MLHLGKMGSQLLDRFLYDEPLVFCDVGASGQPPRKWRGLAQYAWYVGFDPDRRALLEDNSFNFKRFILINKAVSDTEEDRSPFYLTHSPFCSSMLKPKFENIDAYAFSALFRVEKVTSVLCTHFRQVAKELGLKRIDWIKLDSQGKDIDLFRSIPKSLRERILVVDVEPGVTDFYEGENTFTEAHSELLKEDFWLAGMECQKYARVHRETREALKEENLDFALLPGNPTAVEARYFRNIDSLINTHADIRDFFCGWLFSMINGYYGVALDMAVHIQRLEEKTGRILLHETLQYARRLIRRRELFHRSSLVRWIRQKAGGFLR